MYHSLNPAIVKITRNGQKWTKRVSVRGAGLAPIVMNGIGMSVIILGKFKIKKFLKRYLILKISGDYYVAKAHS